MHTIATKIAAARAARRHRVAEQSQLLWEERRRVGLRPGFGDRPYWDTRLPMQAVRALALPYNWLSDRLGAGSAMVVCADRVEAAERVGPPPAHLIRQSG